MADTCATGHGQQLPHSLNSPPADHSPHIMPIKAARRKTPPPVPRRLARKPLPNTDQSVPLRNDDSPVAVQASAWSSAVPIRAPPKDHRKLVYIGVVGITGSGKSSLIQRVTGHEDILVADGLESGSFIVRTGEQN